MEEIYVVIARITVAKTVTNNPNGFTFIVFESNAYAVRAAPMPLVNASIAILPKITETLQAFVINVHASVALLINMVFA